MRCILLAYLLLPLLLVAQSPFAVVELTDSLRPSGGELIKEFLVKGKPVKGICEYWQVLEEAKAQVRELGANCLVVVEHILPNTLECHKLRIQALIIPDPELYEKEIPWSRARLLRIENFQASTQNRPGLAGPVTVLSYSTSINIFNGKCSLTAKALFFPRDSYFVITEDSVSVLAYCQVLFDLTEISARRFVKAVQEEDWGNTSGSELERQLNQLYRSIHSEHLIISDEFSEAVQTDSNNLAIWQARTQQQLSELEAHTVKEFILE